MNRADARFSEKSFLFSSKKNWFWKGREGPGFGFFVVVVRKEKANQPAAISKPTSKRHFLTEKDD